METGKLSGDLAARAKTAGDAYRKGDRAGAARALMDARAKTPRGAWVEVLATAGLAKTTARRIIDRAAQDEAQGAAPVEAEPEPAATSGGDRYMSLAEYAAPPRRGRKSKPVSGAAAAPAPASETEGGAETPNETPAKRVGVRAQRRAAGLCERCGGERDGPQIWCSECRAQDKAYQAAWAERKKAGLTGTRAAPRRGR